MKNVCKVVKNIKSLIAAHTYDCDAALSVDWRV